MHQPSKQLLPAQFSTHFHVASTAPGHAITTSHGACISRRRHRLLAGTVPTREVRSSTALHQPADSVTTKSYHLPPLSVLHKATKLQQPSRGRSTACRFRRDDFDGDLHQSDLLDDKAQHQQHYANVEDSESPTADAPTSQPLIYSSSNISKPDLIRIMETGGVISPQSAAPPASMHSPPPAAAAAAPPLAADNLEAPAGSLSLKSPKQLLTSAFKSLGNPLEPSPATASAAGGNAAGSNATDPDVTAADPAAAEMYRHKPSLLVPPDSLSYQNKEQILSSAAAAAQQVIDVGGQVIADVADHARSAVIRSAADLLVASSAGAVSRRDFDSLRLPHHEDHLRADHQRSLKRVQADHAAAAAAAAGSQLGVAAAAAAGNSDASYGCIAVSGDIRVQSTAVIDHALYLGNPYVIDANPSSSSSHLSKPLANLERSRIEVTNYLNDKREAAAQQLMKQTNVFANRLRESAKQTAHEMGPPVTKAAVALLGRRNVVDMIKLLGRGNTAVAVGIVGGENAAAATEQLGVGGFAEVSKTLGPKGVLKVVEKLGLKGNVKLARKLVLDNADMAVSKMRQSVRDDGNSVRGFMQRCVIGVLWWACLLWFGGLAVIRALWQGLRWAAASVVGSSGSSSSGSSTMTSPNLP